MVRYFALNKHEMLSLLPKMKYVYGNVRLNEDASKYMQLVKKHVVGEVQREYDETIWNVRIEGVAVKVMFID